MTREMLTLIHALGVVTFANEDFDKPYQVPSERDWHLLVTKPGLTPEQVVVKATEALRNALNENDELRTKLDAIYRIRYRRKRLKLVPLSGLVRWRHWRHVIGEVDDLHVERPV